MPTFRLEDQEGRWLTDMRLNAPAWAPGDRIPRGRGTLEVVEVRYGNELVTLVVKGHGPRERLAQGLGERQDLEVTGAARRH
jgi:hypothetical protein